MADHRCSSHDVRAYAVCVCPKSSDTPLSKEMGAVIGADDEEFGVRIVTP